jgi:hypothetical protein
LKEINMTSKDHEQYMREVLDCAVEQLRQNPAAAIDVAVQLRDAILEEDGPIPIYGAPADVYVTVAYAGPPVYVPSEHVKQWNRKHDLHPYTETLLVRKLRNIGLKSEQIDSVLTIIDDICPNCWNADRHCQCENDR